MNGSGNSLSNKVTGFTEYANFILNFVMSCFMFLTKIERRENLTTEEFRETYIKNNRPVIITDGIRDWNAKVSWNPEYLLNNYGEEEVQLYDDLFNLIDIVLLKDYLYKYFNNENKNPTNEKIIPYIRWYTRLKDCNFVWSDHFFNTVKGYWKLPYFLPDNNYLLPYDNIKEKLDPSVDMFPAKGIFISGKGAKTRLHYDPWCSDAILCQIYGAKKVTLYHPSKKRFLCKEGEMIDIDNPDYQKFTNFSKVEPDFVDFLYPGEIIFFPNNWLHHVLTVEDSISITWNFVHISTWKSFFNYLTNNPNAQELEVIKFFLNSNEEQKVEKIVVI